MSWKEHGTKTADVADKGLNALDKAGSIADAIKWVCILVVVLVALWIGLGIKSAVEGSAEAIGSAVTSTKETVVDVKEGATKLAIGTKDALVAASESETAQGIRNEVAGVKEDIVNSEEFKDAKEKAGEVLTNKIGGFFKKKEEPVEEKVESEEDTTDPEGS